ncbi:MAG: HDIG domain-containing protein [Thermoleophilaceae bacterium]|nr:HDIG domain-containing protein [Thermoleophilaceae bacterium]
MSRLAERLWREEPVKAVCRALGETGGVWIVGGTLRDALIGRPVADVDLAVSGDAEQIARAVREEAGGAVFPLSEKFGAWRAMAHDRTWVCDVSPLQGDSIEADLAKRDFSVNAMALGLGERGEPLDPRGGQDDLEAGILRVLGAEAYAADPLRPLRLVRLAGELGFAPDEQTARLTAEAAPRVPEASPERIWAELRRLVAAPGALEALALADRLGITRAVLPELGGLHGVEQSKYHHLDVYEHTLEVLAKLLELTGELEERFGLEDAARLRAVLGEPLGDELTRGAALRFGALLHDIGKPGTRGVRADGRVTFIGHDARGADMIGALAKRLRMSDRVREFLAGLATHHLVLGFLVHERPLSKRAVYRYLAATSPVEVEVTLLSCADRLATRGANADAAIASHVELARELMHAALDWRDAGPPSLPLRGDELACELGIEPGPELGRLIDELREAAYAGEVGDAAQMVSAARVLRENRSS